MHRYPFAQGHKLSSKHIPEVKSKDYDLQVQTLSCHNVSSDLRERFLEFQSKFVRTHDFSSLSHLSEEFFKTAEETDERSFVDICHFTVER